eukprot:TRINITY_DN16631_c0_g1_i1.p1 TRINITY_DN16631_c0_g1~~TRINITY_DN16631_c0_g1_i1.p1  ORF type:complete len:1027 (-),score=126.78 TRINITY_DN16631_c0_g1_i1:3-3056(-)
MNTDRFAEILRAAVALSKRVSHLASVANRVAVENERAAAELAAPEPLKHPQYSQNVWWCSFWAYCRGEWHNATPHHPPPEVAPRQPLGGRPLRIITWNILFDEYDKDVIHTSDRYPRVLAELRQASADVVALQEVTEIFVTALQGEDWVRDEYYLSEITRNAIFPYGQLILTRKSLGMPQIQVVWLSRVKKAVTAFLPVDGTMCAFTVVHLTANNKGEDRSAAREEQLSALLPVFENCPIHFIMGDFNTSDDPIPLLSSLEYRDVFHSSTGRATPGWTYDPFVNPTANVTKGPTSRERRFDRIFVRGLTLEPEVPWQLLGTEPFAFDCAHCDKTVRLCPSDHYGVRFDVPLMYAAQSQAAEPNPFSLIAAVEDALRGATVKALVLFGSRLQGAAKRDSDWDFLAVVDGPYYPGPRLVVDTPLVNVMVYHEIFWRYMQVENVIWAYMCQRLPPFALWFSRDGFAWGTPFAPLRLECLRRAVTADVEHHYAKAKRLHRESNINKSKKNISHGLRWISYANQLIQFGKIRTFHDGNAVLSELLALPTDISWDELDLMFGPRIKEGLKALIGATEPPKLVPLGDNIIPFIAGAKGLELLQRHLAVRAIKSRAHPALCLLVPDNVYSPTEHPIVRQANGCVVDLDSFSFAAAPPRAFISYDAKHAPAPSAADWGSARLTQKIDGVRATLYHHAGKWHVASTASPDGSELVLTELLNDGTAVRYYSNTPNYTPWTFFETKLAGSLANGLNGITVPAGAIGEFSLGLLKRKPLTFADVFWAVFHHLGYKLPETPTNLTYIFELQCEALKLIISPFDPAAVGKPALVLHSVLDNTSRRPQAASAISASLGWSCSAEFKERFNSLPEVVAFLTERSPRAICGVMVELENGVGIKVKSPQYRAIRNLAWYADDAQRCKRLMLEVVRCNSHTDFLSRVPTHLADSYQLAAAEYRQFCSHITEVYEACVSATQSGSAAAFAEKANAYPVFKKVLFDMRTLSCTVEQYFAAHCTLNKMLSYLPGVLEASG